MTLELTDEVVGHVLVEHLVARQVTLRAWRLRSIHRRGRSATSLLLEGDVTDADGAERTLLYVVHGSRRPVPDGAGTVVVGDVEVHVWQFPDDPYLPGLRPAVSRRTAQERLRRLGLASGEGGRPGIHTRSYRPTRRAVVELTPVGASSPALYLKVLGGRDPARVAGRAETLAAVHEHLAEHLPVPRVLMCEPATGTVALERLHGPTLRQLLRSGGRLPEVGDVAALVARIAAVPPPPGDARPVRYADVRRHVELLTRAVPDRADDLAAVAAAVAGVAGPTGTVHGDLHDGQLLVPEGRVTGLLDVDGAGTGPIALDAGRLVANIEVAGVTAPAQATTATRYATSLAERLDDLVPRQHLALAAAGAWIGLATGPQRIRGDGWRDATRRRVDRAVAWVDRA